MSEFNTPVLLLIFNRPETTRQVFEQIKSIRPKHLFVAADGPRLDHDDINLCNECRDIITNIDWDCDLKTLFRENNLGCGTGPAKAISWFFEHVEEGIILEDDCLPNRSFFRYCELLLKKYRNEHQIMHIGGNNFQRGIQRGSGDYYFSIYNHIWGWATWKRAWRLYDMNMSDFNKDHLSKLLKSYFKAKQHQEYWLNIFERCHKDKPSDIWDYQWTYTIWNRGGFSITPQRNLVSNIGFGERATHTIEKESWLSKLPSIPLIIKKHPEKIELNYTADYYSSVNVFKLNTRKDELVCFLRRVKQTAKTLLQLKKNI
ncbi:hypothetical protein [Daejeonella oryzae]|uniref:hypothetical protein n=1 Tax=Daejeonella oryzae TaxID=1122943 RepID=UPI0003F95FE4|nr:hypothetical protein [Daejeonella oryzae]